MKEKLVTQMQSYVAETCIGASALRNQGGSGLLAKSRDLFKTIDLAAILRGAAGFDSWLGLKTQELKTSYPVGCRNFGAARKALNLFLRSAAYNIVLSRAHNLDQLLPLLELPLDSYVANHLQARNTSLPRKWVGLKSLGDPAHRKYQGAAQVIASNGEVHRVDLDVFFYRKDHRA